MISAFGVDHGGISKKMPESARKGAEAGAIFGGGLGATRGGLQAIGNRKAFHAAAAGNKAVARGAMVGHTAGKGVKGAAIGAAGVGALGYALRPRKDKKKR